MKMFATLAAFLLIGCCECPPPKNATEVLARPCEAPPDEEVMDWSGKKKSAYLLACEHLRDDLHCPEGDPPPKDAAGVPLRQSCTQTLREAVELRISVVTPECILEAKTVVDVRKCNVRCLAK